MYAHRPFTEQTKNNQGGHEQRDMDYSNQRMYSPDAVRALQFYFSKLHLDCDRLFQTPLKNFTKNKEVWFSREPLGHNTISKMMKRMGKKAGLDGPYTNHCVRATTATNLFQAGVSADKIRQITLHKNDSSLKHYASDMSAEQKRHCSSILERPLTKIHGRRNHHKASGRYHL